MRELLDRHLGEGWPTRADDPATWEPVDGISDDELWAVRDRAAPRPHRRSCASAASSSAWPAASTPSTSTRPPSALDPDALTIGFARRLATYKRLDLLLADPDRDARAARAATARCSCRRRQGAPAGRRRQAPRPAAVRVKRHPQVAGRVVFLDDYDLALAATLVRGCDVWVNVPRPPLEASGTSGMKNAVNGGLHAGRAARLQRRARDVDPDVAAARSARARIARS